MSGEPESSLGNRIARGAAWSALNATALRLGQFIMGIVIARMVAPDVFGVFVVASTIFMIVINFSDMGVTSALIRDVAHADRLGPTVASISISMNALFASLMVLTAPLLAELLRAPGATRAIQVLALTVLVAGFTSVPSAVLTGTFRQRERLLADLASLIISNASLVLMLLNGGGVMALAWSRVIGQCANALVIIVASPTNYRPGFDRVVAGELLRFGLPLSGASLVGLLVGNADFLVVGRVLGPLQLGYYNLAYNVSGWPVSVFTAVAINVAMPAFSRVRDEAHQLRSYFVIALKSLAAVTFPTSCVLFVLSGPLVETVYGERWVPAAPALAVLAVFGCSRVFIALICDLLVAMGHTTAFLRLQVAWLVLLVPVLIAGVHWLDSVGAGLAHVAVALGVVLPILLRIVRPHLPWLTAGLVGRALWAPALASVAQGAVSWLVARQFETAWIGLVLGGAVGGLVYLAVLGRWLRATLVEVRTLRGAETEGRFGPAVQTAPEGT